MVPGSGPMQTSLNRGHPWPWTGLLKSQARAGSQLLQNFECEFQIHQEKVAEIVKFM